MIERRVPTLSRTRPRIALMLCIFSALLSLLITTASGLAQDDARAVAARVQSFYDRTTSVQARFHQTYFHKLYNRYDNSDGTVAFKKPGKMRWDYSNRKVIATNGQRLLIYEPPEEGETEGQGFEHEMSEHQLPDAFAFLTGSGRLENLFTFRLLDAQRQGFPEGDVLELTPRNPSPHYERLVFYVRNIGEGADAAAVVQRVLIIDAAGNRNRFDFSEMQFNRDVPDARFNFSFPPNTRRVTP